MRRLKILLFTLVLAFICSQGVAQTAQKGFGVYTGWPALLGVQFSIEDLRVSGGLAPSFSAFGASLIGITASVDYIFARAPLPLFPGLDLEYFVGGGLTGLLYMGSAGSSSRSMFSWDAHGLLGVQYIFTGGQFGIFVESQVGFGSYSGVFGPAFGGRTGVIFR